MSLVILQQIQTLILIESKTCMYLIFILFFKYKYNMLLSEVCYPTDYYYNR